MLLKIARSEPSCCGTVTSTTAWTATRRLHALAMFDVRRCASRGRRQEVILFSSSSSDSAASNDDNPVISQTRQPRRRLRSRHQQNGGGDDVGRSVDGASFLNIKAVPSLKDFMHRNTVLSMYRGFLRSARYVKVKQRNSVMADELINEIRREFKSQKNESDPFQRQRAVADGQRRAAELRGLTGEPDHTRNENDKNGKLQQKDADSWISIVDPEDQRGRVGSGWPWMK